MRWVTRLVALATAFLGVRRTQAHAECSDKIICPLTGEEICRCCCPLNG